MEITRPTVTVPDKQGAFGIQNGTETFYMHPRGKNDLVYEQHGFNSFEDTCSAIGLVVSELHAEQVGNNFCYIDLGLGACIRLNACQSSVSITFSPSIGSKGISPLAVRKLTEIKVLLASLVSE